MGLLHLTTQAEASLSIRRPVRWRNEVWLTDAEEQFHAAASPSVVRGLLERLQELEAAAAELHEWAIDACCQGTETDGPFGDDNCWHAFMSTWEQADEMLPRLAPIVRRGVSGVLPEDNK